MKSIFRPKARLTAVAAAAAVLGLASGSAMAGQKPLTAQTFVTKAGGTNLMEIKLGHLAEQKSHNSAVDDFAKRMISDHTQLQDQLEQTAKAENLNVPSEVPGKMQKKYDKMEKLSGKKFDKAYAHFNVKGHHEAVQLFKKEKQSNNDAALSKLAANGLPIIETHYQLSQQLAKQVGASN